ncbi:MAG: TauD/TfdA family dioxygenase [Myxococcota bacterium]
MPSPPFLSIPEQLRWDDNVFPQILHNTESLTSIEVCESWIQTHQSQLEEALEASGALLFRGFPIHDAQTFERFSAAFAYPNFTYQESLSNAVRINHTPRVFTANEAPKDVEIYLHHEMAQTPVFPGKLFFFCQSAAERGGATPICRSDMLYHTLLQEHPATAQMFEQKGLRYIKTMPALDDPESGQGRSWKSTLSVEDQHQAEQKLTQLGYTWEWQPDHSIKTITPVLPAVKMLPSGKKVFFNQVIAVFLGWQGAQDDPSSALRFGDHTSIPSERLQHVVEASIPWTFDIPWQDGDIALVDNLITMHGRRPYSGIRKRQVLVAMTAMPLFSTQTP